MNFLSGFVTLAILVATSQVVSSVPITRRDVDESLIPQFGISPVVNPTGMFPPNYESFSVADASIHRYR